MALNLLIDVSKQNYVSYVRSYYAVQVMIHDPVEYPESSINKAISQPGFETIIAVKPSVVVSDESIRSMDLIQRECLFKDEAS